MDKKKGFEIPKSTRPIDFEEGAKYHGAELVVRMDVPIETFLQIQDMVNSGDGLRAYGVFGDQVLESWNMEKDGKPLPPTGEGMNHVTPDFANIVMSAWIDAVTGVSDPLDAPSANGSTSAELSALTVPLSDNPTQ